MKLSHLLILSLTLFLLCSCAIFDGYHPVSTPLSVPVGKNWQVIEEAPKLSNERERLPFQMEQSVQPDVAKPLSPEEGRKIEIPQ